MDATASTTAPPTTFADLARRRRAVRHFRPDPLPPGLLEELLQVAQQAPSGYNLQPTHFVVVDDPSLKAPLARACMNQRQVLEAPATVVFTGDRRVMRNNLDAVLAVDRQAGAIEPAYEQRQRRFVKLAFDTGPAGLGWVWKALLPPIGTCVRPIPGIPAVHRRYWLAKQVMLTAMLFMLTAQDRGVGTCPMEGFDERWVRRSLGIPRSHIVPVVVPVGFAADEPLGRTRLPLEGRVHRNGW